MLYLFLFNLYKNISEISTILFSSHDRKRRIFRLFYIKNGSVQTNTEPLAYVFSSIYEAFKPRFLQVFK